MTSFALIVYSNIANASGLEKFGSAMQVLMPVTAAGITYVENDREGFWQLAKSEVSTALLTEGLKAGIHSQRPNQRGDDSFPSGHASVTFSAAQFLQQRYGSDYGIPAYVLASVTAYSRVHANEHRWRDVIGGAALGIGSTYYFTESKQSRLALIPAQKSVMLSYQRVW
nr:phosphatase PAP2 family protein [Polynucleobacter sp. MWH-Loch1C5]